VSKTAQDGDLAGELHEVTTEAHSQSAQNADTPEDLDERTANGRPAPGTEYMESTPGSQAAPAGNGAAAAVEIAEEPVQGGRTATQGAGSRADAAASGEALDFDQAERFAASFRPSWAPERPVTPSAPAPVHVRGPARVVRVGTRTDVGAPKIRKQRGAAYAILSASLLGAVGLFYLAISSSTERPSPAELARPATTKRNEPVETSIQAAQQPPAAPVAPVVPAAPPAAAEPQPAAEPEPQPEQLAAAEPAANEPAAAAPVEEPAPPPPPAVEAKQPEVAAAPPAAEPKQAAAAPPRAADEVTAPQPKPAPAVAAAALAAAPTAATKPTPPSAAAPKAVAQPSVAPAQAKVLLSLAAFPPNTQLRIDGGIVENPFRMRLPRASKHRVEARAPGYAPESRVVRMDGDMQLMFSLKRDPIRDVKPDPYKDARHSASNGPGASHPRGAGFVTDNPY
jgi:hypothetical protein